MILIKNLFFHSNHSNNSLLNENSEHTIENRPSVHSPDVDILRKFNGGHNNNNNFLNNNNNNNNNTIHKNHKIDKNMHEHKSGACSDLKHATTVCSVQNRSDEIAVIRQEIDIEGDDIIETSTHSSKSNFSNIDVEIEKDERKPNLKSFAGIMTSATANDSNGWISCNSPTDKLINEPTSIYTNCDNDTTITHQSNNGINIMANSLKKEVSVCILIIFRDLIDYVDALF